MQCMRRFCTWTLFIFAISPIVAQAQAPPAQPQGAPGEAQPREGRQPRPADQGQPRAPQPQVVATVNGEPITQKEVEANLQPQLQGRQVDPQTVQQLQSRVLDNLIQSRLVEQYVVENGPEVAQEEIDAVVDRLKQQLTAQNVSLDQFLASQGQTSDTFQARIEASLAWQKFQQRQLTDEKLAGYFQQNRQQFDTENFDEARQEVANAYLGQLWQQIVTQMKPNAEIRVKAEGQPRANAQPAPDRRPAPQRLP